MNQSQQFIVNGSAHSVPLPDGMIHTVVTSPPYFSLRKYQGQQEVDWPAVSYSPMPGMPEITIPGCDPDCEHEWVDYQIAPKHSDDGITGSTLDGGKTTQAKTQRETVRGAWCQNCGGWRGALGLEPTPEAYIGHLVACFREVKRVLRDDGVVWCVMGDSFAAGGTGGAPSDKSTLTKHGKDGRSPQLDALGKGQSRTAPPGLQQGDLMLIPHRLALALQGDGWIVRNDPVFAKVAPMPESVSGWRWERCRVKVGKSERATSDVYTGNATSPQSQVRGPSRNYDVPQTEHWHPCPGCDKCTDTGGYVLRRGSWRHTRAHETVLMCVKGMNYYADQERVREEGSLTSHGGNGPNPGQKYASLGQTDGQLGQTPHQVGASGRNPRSVLTPSPESYSGPHYAVFPRSLIGPLLRATAPTRVCPVCGAPWCPVVERENPSNWDERKALFGAIGGGMNQGRKQQVGAGWSHNLDSPNNQILAHRPTCDHNADPIPGWVLDPFAGTFTTGAVCAELGVNAIGLDISHEYLDDHAKPRIGLTPAKALDGLPLFEGMDP